jgi:hypothetical protein
MLVLNCSPVNRDSRLTTHDGKLSEARTPSIPDVTAGRTHNHRRNSGRIAHFILLKNDDVEGFPHTHRSEDSKDGVGE